MRSCLYKCTHKILAVVHFTFAYIYHESCHCSSNKTTCIYITPLWACTLSFTIKHKMVSLNTHTNFFNYYSVSVTLKQCIVRIQHSLRLTTILVPIELDVETVDWVLLIRSHYPSWNSTLYILTILTLASYIYYNYTNYCIIM